MKDRVTVLLRRAEATLSAAKRDVEAGDPLNAASRAYYACFHSAVAALETVGAEAKTHKGTHGMFYKHFVADGPLETRHAEILQTLFADRLDADYIRDGDFSIGDGREAVDEAESFVNDVRSVLESA